MDVEKNSKQKMLAAVKAVEFVEDGMVVGLGTGATTQYAILEIVKRIKDGSLKDLACIPSSSQTESFSKELGIELSNFEDSLKIDINIDGADEVDSELNLIKGGGGALLREKVLAQASKRNIVVVDESKISSQLGTNWPVPIEVLPFAWRLESKFVESIGATVDLRRDESGDVYITDQNNYILDCNFGPIQNLNELSEKFCSRAGIIEHGLFLKTTTDLIVGSDDGVKHIIK